MHMIYMNKLILYNKMGGKNLHVILFFFFFFLILLQRC